MAEFGLFTAGGLTPKNKWTADRMESGRPQEVLLYNFNAMGTKEIVATIHLDQGSFVSDMSAIVRRNKANPVAT